MKQKLATFIKEHPGVLLFWSSLVILLIIKVPDFVLILTWSVAISYSVEAILDITGERNKELRKSLSLRENAVDIAKGILFVSVSSVTIPLIAMSYLENIKILLIITLVSSAIGALCSHLIVIRFDSEEVREAERQQDGDYE